MNLLLEPTGAQGACFFCSGLIAWFPNCRSFTICFRLWALGNGLANVKTESPLSEIDARDPAYSGTSYSQPPPRA